MENEAVNLVTATEVSVLKHEIAELEAQLKRLDHRVGQQARSITQILNRLIGAITTGGNIAGNFENGGFHVDIFQASQGQLLAEIASAITRAMQRNL